MRDYKLEGIGTMNGGEYGSVILAGIVNGNGNITADTFKCEGIIRLKSSLFVNGDAAVEGTFTAETVRAGNFRSKGVLKITGNTLAADDINGEGMLTCANEVIVQNNFRMDGICTARKVTAQTIDIKTSTSAAKYIDESMGSVSWLDSVTSGIFGQNVSVKHSTITEINCVHITAKRTKCDIIRASSVNLKDNCTVGKLYCDGEINIDNSCTVGEIISMGSSARYQPQTTSNEQKKEEIKMDEKMKEDILNIITMFKDNAIDAAKATDMIAASAYVSSMKKSADSDGFDVDIDWKDDGKLHVAAFIGHKFIKKGLFNQLTNEFTVNLENVQPIDVDCRGHLVCGNVAGNVSAGSHVQAGDVQGSVSAGSHVGCGNVGNNVAAGSHVNCGNISGKVNAGGGVRTK